MIEVGDKVLVVSRSHEMNRRIGRVTSPGIHGRVLVDFGEGEAVQLFRDELVLMSKLDKPEEDKNYVDVRFHFAMAEPEYEGAEPYLKLDRASRLAVMGLDERDLTLAAELAADSDRVLLFFANSVPGVVTEGGSASVADAD